jgi:hypothetical protein
LQSLSVAAQDIGPGSIFFKPDGPKMYMTGIENLSIYEYDLSTPWNVTTAVFLQSLFVRPLITSPGGLFFRDTGLQMYLVDFRQASIIEYNLV